MTTKKQGGKTPKPMGGKRDGAGRKPAPVHLRRDTVTIRLPRWLIDAMPDDGRSALVERALCRLMKLRAPKCGV